MDLDLVLPAGLLSCVSFASIAYADSLEQALTLTLTLTPTLTVTLTLTLTLTLTPMPCDHLRLLQQTGERTRGLHRHCARGRLGQPDRRGVPRPCGRQVSVEFVLHFVRWRFQTGKL